MNNITKIEKILNSVVAERCSEIAEKLYHTKDEIKEKYNKLKVKDINEKEYWNLHADIQNIIQKQIYIYAFADGIKFQQNINSLKAAEITNVQN